MGFGANRTCIVNFHGIGVPHAGVPPSEAPYWLPEARFRAVMERAAALRDGGRDIAVTFDDGNLSDLEIAAPVLSELGFRGEFFVLTGRLERPHYLKPDDVRTLIGMGMEIGLHGRDHVDWRGLDETRLTEETQAARRHLEDVAGCGITKVAIPFGAYDRRVIARLKAADFRVIYTSDGGPASSSSRVRARTTLRSDMSGETIEAIFSGRQPLRRRLRRAASAFLRRHVL